MTTFSSIQSAAVFAGDPASITLTTAITDDNLLVAICGQRAGGSHTAHAVTDSNSGTWTKHLGYDNEIGNSNARLSVSVWSRIVGSVTETDTTPDVDFDDGTSASKGLCVVEIEPNAAYDFTFQEHATDGSGTGDWDGQGSGNTASVSESDLFVLAWGVARVSNTSGRTTDASFSSYDDVNTDHPGAANQYFLGFGFETAGQASGVKSTTITANGTNNEGVVGVVAFSDAASGSTYTLAADAGAFTLTGQAATLKMGFKVGANSGSYALTGQAASLLTARKLAGDSGSFTLTGAAATLAKDSKLVSNPGSYTFTGQAADLEFGRKLTADAGSYVFTGQTAGLVFDRKLAANSGSFTLTGGDVADLSDFILTAGEGSFTFTGSSADLQFGRKLAANVAAFTLTGQVATLQLDRVLTATAASYSISGSATLKLGRSLVAESGSFSLTGSSASLAFGRHLGASSGSYTLTGADATLTKSAAVLKADAGVFVLTGGSVNAGGVDRRNVLLGSRSRKRVT